MHTPKKIEKRYKAIMIEDGSTIQTGWFHPLTARKDMENHTYYHSLLYGKDYLIVRDLDLEQSNNKPIPESNSKDSLCPQCGKSECNCQSDWANSINTETKKIGRTRKAVQSRNETVLGQPIRCYDNGGSDKPKGSLDRYTVVFMHREHYGYNRDYLASHGDIYPCLGMSGAPFHPQGIAQHSDCKLGKHLGRRIRFAELPEDCQKAVLQDLSNEQ